MGDIFLWFVSIILLIGMVVSCLFVSGIFFEKINKHSSDILTKIEKGEFPQKKLEILSFMEDSYRTRGLFGSLSATPFSTTTFNFEGKMYLAKVVDENEQIRVIRFEAIEKIADYGKDIQLSFYEGDGQRYQPEILIPRSKIKQRYY